MRKVTNRVCHQSWEVLLIIWNISAASACLLFVAVEWYDLYLCVPAAVEGSYEKIISFESREWTPWSEWRPNVGPLAGWLPCWNVKSPLRPGSHSLDLKEIIFSLWPFLPSWNLERFSWFLDVPIFLCVSIWQVSFDCPLKSCPSKVFFPSSQYLTPPWRPSTFAVS